MNRCFKTQRGAATVELALVTPLLLIIMLGVVEFGRAFEFVHAVSGLSRESANVAARGATLQETVASALTSGADIALQTQGGVVASQIVGNGTKVVIADQFASTGYTGKSRLGGKGAPAGSLSTLPFKAGQTAYVVEVFYPYKPVTPLSAFAKLIFPSTLYSRSVF